MRIAVDAREFTAGRTTGIRRYLHNLLLPLVNDHDLNFILFANDPAAVPAVLRSSKAKLVRLLRAPTLFVDQIVLPYLARKEETDVFFSPYYKVPLCGSFRRIITVHDVMFLRLAPRGMAEAMKRPLVRAQLRAATRKADVILTDSGFTGKDLATIVPRSAGKLRTLYPDLAAEWIERPSPEDIENAKSRFAGGRPFALYAGNFKPHKNVPLLVCAFAELVKSGIAGDRALVLAGGDPVNSPAVKSLANKLDAGNRISIAGNVSDADLRALYAAADWSVSPSSYEGFGYPAIESMAVGCPVICSTSTALGEVTGHFVVPIRELSVEGTVRAFAMAFEMSASEREDLRQKSVEHAKKFGPGTAAAQFRSALESLPHD
jgi:glycosyltransferase involved in cell wall biosynthesis